MPNHGFVLELDRCPHCNVDKPNLMRTGNQFVTSDHTKTVEKIWANYTCSRCGGVVLAWSQKGSASIEKIFPPPLEVDENVPSRAKEYLEQAINSISSPAGSVMLAASSVDAMMKDKGLKDGTLYTRIKQAAESHLITPEMEEWAHDVRLDANDQRHSDNNSLLPKSDDAIRVIDFVQALAMFLYVLPSQVRRGRESASKKS